MTLKELEKIVARGENEWVEFKHKINFPDKIARELVAFANTSGGKLFVGIDDNCTIFGLKNPQEEIFAMQQVISSYVVFPLNHEIELIEVNPKKSVVVVNVTEAVRKPNYAKDNPRIKFGKAYVRVGDKSIQASKLIMEILRKQSSGFVPKVIMGVNEIQILKSISDEKLTFEQICEKSSLSKNVVSDILVRLVLSNNAQVIPDEHADLFIQKK
ncbi:MAG: ATP-binding protein [Bacteroidota bacterium]|nr:ATP-binding protein [Bacteroidota bacterium]